MVYPIDKHKSNLGKLPDNAAGQTAEYSSSKNPLYPWTLQTVFALRSTKMLSKLAIRSNRELNQDMDSEFWFLIWDGWLSSLFEKIATDKQNEYLQWSGVLASSLVLTTHNF